MPVNPQRTAVTFAPQGPPLDLRSPFYTPINIGSVGPELYGACCTVTEQSAVAPNGFVCQEQQPCQTRFSPVPYQMIADDDMI